MNDGCGPLSLAAVRRGAPWLLGQGAEGDVVISSRVRLARNIAGSPFPHRAMADQRARVLASCKDALVKVTAPQPGAPRLAWVDVHALPAIARTVLVERHIMSKELARGAGALSGQGGAAPVADAPPADAAAPAPTWARGLAVSVPDEMLSVMVNEEDHLRLQVVLPGLSLARAHLCAVQADEGLGRVLDYAFSARFGFLTACPTNVGGGVRMSVMLHLPALRLTGEIERARRAAKDLNLAVRGFYGEGSESIGDLYQISNQTTLGRSEEQILRGLEREILPQVLDYERAARRVLVERKRRLLEDHVFRALGILRHARLLAPDEALALLSMVRLGVLTGLIQDVTEQAVNPLFVLAQPAHVQWLAGRELDQQQRREARADVVRRQLGGP
ncbi:MAG: ATP--guanido phosphotransferase [Phycisphaerales bacterium]